MTTEATRAEVSAIENLLSLLESEQRDAIRAEEARIRAEYAPRVAGFQAQRSELLKQLAATAPVGPGDVIFKLDRPHSETYWRVHHVRDEGSFNAYRVKANGEDGETRERFYVSMKDLSWELVRKAGEPAPENELTAKMLTALLIAAKVPEGTRYRAGFAIEERAHTLRVDCLPSFATGLEAVAAALAASGREFREIEVKRAYSDPCKVFEVSRVPTTAVKS